MSPTIGVSWSFCCFLGVFSPNSKSNHVETWPNNRLQPYPTLLSPPQTLHASWELTPRNPWHRHRGKTSLHFLFRNRCSLQTSLQRNAKKKCVWVAFHSKFAKANISRVWKLQNVGPVYECLTLTRTNEHTVIIWNTLICIRSAGTIKSKMHRVWKWCSYTHGNHDLLLFQEQVSNSKSKMFGFSQTNPKQIMIFYCASVH